MSSRGAMAVALAALLSFCAAHAPPNKVMTKPAASISPSAAAAPRDPWQDAQASDPRWQPIDDAVHGALAENKLPGCVVVIGRHDRLELVRAYGSRAVEPAREPMTLDTVFDLASLTKPMATAASLMVLVARGVVDLDEHAARYLPELARTKPGITVRQLLLHTSGLVPDTALSDFERGESEAWRKLFDAPTKSQPGERFVYSDVGYILLGELVHRVSGQDLAAFTHANIYGPLAMTETMFLPDAPLRARAAPTEQRDGVFLRGDVHDPRAHLLGGVAGHAGLFSTARDLTRFAQAWLESSLSQTALFGVASEVVRAFTAPHDVPSGVRALGWDVLTTYSKQRGEGMSRRAFGHGGFTGTSLWMDPELDLFVLFLSNRVHPNGTGAVNEVVGQISSVAVRTLAPAAVLSCGAPTRTGIDVLRAEDFAALRGQRIALLTNAAARASDGTRTVDALAHAKGVKLVRIFSPEHGFDAKNEGAVGDSRDAATGVPIVSLYGDALTPPAESLADIDAIVVDLQDVGVRFYTYASTMRRALASAKQLRFVVLDRPNPIDGIDVAGPLPDPGTRTFVHDADVPVRHGMTLGELAVMFDAEQHLGARLTIVPVLGWRRADYLDATGLVWNPPSPNLRNVGQVVLYPGVALLEGSNLSVGRGTETPFEIVGAPFVDGSALARALTRRNLAGVTFASVTFTPQANPFRGEICNGVRITVTDRATFEPIRTGLAIASDLRTLAPTWRWADVGKLLANKAALDAVGRGASLTEIEATWSKELAAFRAKREKYLLYSACP